jgi:hypothetical protein
VFDIPRYRFDECLLGGTSEPLSADSFHAKGTGRSNSMVPIDNPKVWAPDQHWRPLTAEFGQNLNVLTVEPACPETLDSRQIVDPDGLRTACSYLHLGHPPPELRDPRSEPGPRHL